MDSRLKGISIESKNTRNRVRTKKLWSSEIGNQQSENDNCVPPPGLLHIIACYSTLDEFLSLKGLEFGYTYFKEICSPISLVYPTILNHSIRMSDDQTKNMGFG